MEYRKRRNLIVLFICLLVALAGSYLMYRNDLRHTGDRLREAVRFQAGLVAALSSVERKEHRLKSADELQEVIGEHLQKTFGEFRPVGRSVEYRIGRLSDNQVEILARNQVFPQAAQLAPERLVNWQDQALGLALLGGSGLIESIDRTGREVLAAYSAVDGTDMGVVAQIRIGEIQSEFVSTGVLFITLGVALVILSSLLFVHYTEPLLTQLTREKERYEYAIDAAEDGIWDWNVETGRAWRSPRLQRIYGFEPGSMGRHIDEWKSLVHPDDWPRIETSIKRGLESGLDDYCHEYRMRHARGEWIWVVVKGRIVSRNREGKPLRVVGTLRDISRRKEAELALESAHQRLERSERYFRQLFERAPLAYQSLDIDGNILEVNDAWLDMLGYQRDQVIGHSIADYIEPESRKLLPERFSGFKKRGNVKDLGFTLQKSNGELTAVP